MLRVIHQRNGSIADFRQIKRADIGRHANGNSLVGGHQHIGECGRQQTGLFHGGIVVVHHVHRVKFDIPEQLITEAVQLGFGVSGSCVGHVPGVDLTKVTLGIHKWMQQGFVALGKTHHSLVNGRIAVRVQPHGLAHNVSGLGAGTGQQTHFIHGIEELAVGGLETVDLGNGPGHDHRHSIGHIVDLQCFRDRLFRSGANQTHNPIGIHFFLINFRIFLLSCHSALLMVCIDNRYEISANSRYFAPFSAMKFLRSFRLSPSRTSK